MQSKDSDTASGDIPLVLEMEIEEDVPAELEHFLRLVMLGEDKLAHEYFDSVLKRYINTFPVFAEYVDFLLYTRDAARLKQTLLDIDTDGFSDLEKDFVTLVAPFDQLLSNYTDTNLRSKAIQRASSAIRKCASLRAFANTGYTVTQLTTPVNIRLFQILCLLRHYMATQQNDLDKFYAELLQQGHLWEAAKMFQAYFCTNHQRYTSFKAAANNCQNRDIADLALLAVANSHLATISQPFYVKRDTGPSTFSNRPALDSFLREIDGVSDLDFFLREQESTATLLKRVLNGQLGGRRVGEWVENTLRVQRDLEEWQWSKSFPSGHDSLFKTATLLATSVAARAIPGLDNDDAQRAILSDPAADAHSKERARLLLDTDYSSLDTQAKELLSVLEQIRMAGYPHIHLPPQTSSKRVSRISRSRQRYGQDTPESSVAGKSSALSYLRGFSLSSSYGRDGIGSTPAVDAEGQTIGDNYVLGSQIGFGGLSVIKEATDVHSQRKVAVKIVRRQLQGMSEAESEKFLAEFDHEIELWRFLSHRHIVPLETVYRLDEAIFCFMPLVSKGSLFELVRSNRQGLSTDLATRYSHHIASALCYLHLEAGVVHRDITLENCLLDQDPERPDGPPIVRLCDFGQAEWMPNGDENTLPLDPSLPTPKEADRLLQIRDGSVTTSTRTSMIHSLEYTAPEILRLSQDQALPGFGARSDLSDPVMFSPAVDIWAFAVCVYSLFVGSRPFQNPFQPKVVMSILSGDWDVDRLVLKGGNEVTECVKGCFEMDVGDRWDVSRVLKSAWLKDVSSEGEASERP